MMSLSQTIPSSIPDNKYSNNLAFVVPNLLIRPFLILISVRVVGLYSRCWKMVYPYRSSSETKGTTTPQGLIVLISLTSPPPHWVISVRLICRRWYLNEENVTMRQIYQDKKSQLRIYQKYSTTKLTLLSIKILLIKKCIKPTLIFNEIITQAYSSIIINKTEQKTKQ